MYLTGAVSKINMKGCFKGKARSKKTKNKVTGKATFMV